MPKLRARPRDPLILNRWVDVAYIVYWLIYAAWGVMTLVVGLPTLEINTPEWYSTVWAGALGGLSAVAGITAATFFWDSKRFHFIAKKKFERSTVLVLLAFILVYPGLLIGAAFAGDESRMSLAVHSLSYLVFPVLRLYILSFRIKAFETANQEIVDAGK